MAIGIIIYLLLGLTIHIVSRYPLAVFKEYTEEDWGDFAIDILLGVPIFIVVQLVKLLIFIISWTRLM